MTMTITTLPTASYRGPLPPDVAQRIRDGLIGSWGGGIYHDTDGASWTDEGGGVWSRWPAPGTASRPVRAAEPSPGRENPAEAPYVGRYIGGPHVSGRVISWADATREQFRERGALVRERITPETEIEWNEPPLTTRHGRDRVAIGQFVDAERDRHGYVVTWRLRNDLPVTRSLLADGAALSIGFDYVEQPDQYRADEFARAMNWADFGDTHLVRRLTSIRIGHVAICEPGTGAYPNSRLYPAGVPA
jgi:hypothetical protein